MEIVRRLAAALCAVALALACGEQKAAVAPAEPAAATEAPAPAPAPETGANAVAPAPTPATLASLRQSVGKYPRDVALFDTDPLHDRLTALLGDRYFALLANFGTQGQLSQEGDVLYVIGNKPHAGGDSQAIVLIDLGQDLIHVKLLEKLEMADYRERDVEIVLPEEVQATIANWNELAREEGE